VYCADLVQDELGITARLEWTEGGYRFFSFSEDLVGISLPKELVNIEYNKRGVKFSTRELVGLPVHPLLSILTSIAQAQCPASAIAAGGV